jgi:decaprenylphospho-beta-D-erythro-pentofuranosid-2-ulose 2-reductase
MLDAFSTPANLLLLGGTSEIALEIASAWVDRGCRRVVLAARPSPGRTEAAEDLRARGVVVDELDFEALDTGAHAQLVEAAAQGGDIDVAVVAFGVLGDEGRLEGGTGPGQSEAVALAQVNYVAAVSVGVLLAETLRSQGHGVIVALSSVAGERVRRSNFLYGSSKAGMDGFFLGLGETLRGTGVRVLVVRPGFVRTRMTDGLEAAPLAVGPEQVAAAVLDGVASGAELIWVPGQLRLVMSVLRHVPRRLFRRLPI